MPSVDFNTAFGAVSAIATAAGAYVAWYFARRSEGAAQAQQRLAAMSAVEEWRRELREWSGEVVDVLSEAEYQLHLGEGAMVSADLQRCVHRLSALVDRGRQYLPNQDKDKYGLQKPYAYQGYRHATLDPLVAALRVMDRKVTPPSLSAPDAVNEMRRLFVSRLQRILEPAVRNQEIAVLLEQSGRDKGDDPSLGGLLPVPGVVPSGADALLQATRQAVPRMSVSNSPPHDALSLRQLHKEATEP